VARAVRRAAGSVRLRVAALAAVAFAVVLVAASVALLRVLEQRLEDGVRDADVASLRTEAVDVMRAGIPRAPAPGDAIALAGTGTVAFRIAGDDGRPIVVLSRTPVVRSLPPADAALLQSVAGAQQGGASATFETPLDAGSAGLLGVSAEDGPVMFSTLQVADGVALATASSLTDVQRTLATTRTALWFAIPALVALVGALAWLLVGRALRPVHALTSRVAAIGSESLDERVPVPPSTDEIAELAVTMNGMLDRLERAAQVNRRLVSDASHELRTPITVMRTELEVARRGPATDWDDVAQCLLAELDRVHALVDDLLLMARLAERGAGAHAVDDRVDPADLARDVAGRRRRVPVTVALEAAPVLRGDPDGLRRALDHVVANAARHADGAVEVSVDVVDGFVALCVDDDGPGIAPADRDQVLERFVRLDEGRARDAGGSGLGLAVARDVVVAHGGRIEIGDAPTGGARVTLLVPAGA
jgi:signal transduction histidine kinase